MSYRERKSMGGSPTARSPKEGKEVHQNTWPIYHQLHHSNLQSTVGVCGRNANHEPRCDCRPGTNRGLIAFTGASSVSWLWGGRTAAAFWNGCAWLRRLQAKVELGEDGRCRSIVHAQDWSLEGVSVVLNRSPYVEACRTQSTTRSKKSEINISTSVRLNLLDTREPRMKTLKTCIII
jgi:hypothetical protein